MCSKHKPGSSSRENEVATTNKISLHVLQHLEEKLKAMEDNKTEVIVDVVKISQHEDFIVALVGLPKDVPRIDDHRPYVSWGLSPGKRPKDALDFFRENELEVIQQAAFVHLRGTVHLELGDSREPFVDHNGESMPLTMDLRTPQALLEIS